MEGKPEPEIGVLCFAVVANTRNSCDQVLLQSCRSGHGAPAPYTALGPQGLNDIGHHGPCAQALLDSIAADPDVAVDRLGILGPHERERLLVGFNAVNLAPSELMHPGQTIHGMLEHWANAAPEAPAALYEVTLLLWCLLVARKPSLPVLVTALHIGMGRR